jgi:hypothetical protein
MPKETLMSVNLKLKKYFAIVFSVITFAGIVTPALADFDPSKLIEDKTFSDTQTFGGAAGIQQFLEGKKSVLANTSPDFLQMLREPQDQAVKKALNDPQPNLGRLRTAAELIWDVSVATGINPQVIVVTLQKEQSLISGTFNSTSNTQKALNHALGFGCPDSGGCDNLFNGFYYQLFGNLDAESNRWIGAAASLMRSFNTPNGRGPGIDQNGQTFGSPIIRTSRVGDVITLNNTQGPPNNAPATQTLTLSNSATAALYRYTPHVYNGNYNFWKFFNSWFKYANGTLLKLVGDNYTYIINNGQKSIVPNFVIMSRGLNIGSAITASPTELSSYDTGPVYGPVNNTIITVAGGSPNQLFVFEENTKHPVSSFVLTQRGLNATTALSVAQSEADLFPTGSLLTPKDGTLIQPQNSKAVYVIQNSKKMALTGLTFGQYGYSFKNVVALPAEEVVQYADGGFLLPKNGTLIKFAGDQKVYLIQDQLLHPISGIVFNLKKFSFKNVVTVNQSEVASAGMGGFVAPPENTVFRVTETGSYYIYTNGNKHSISSFVLTQRNLKKSAVVLSLEESLNLPDGLPLTPKDKTLIKGDASGAIYVITNGQKVVLDYNTWVKTYKKKAPTVLTQAEVDSYPDQSTNSQQ